MGKIFLLVTFLGFSLQLAAISTTAVRTTQKGKKEAQVVRVIIKDNVSPHETVGHGRKIFDKDYYTGEAGLLNQEEAYDKSEQYAIGLKSFTGWNRGFLTKFVRNYGTIIFSGVEKNLTADDRKLLFEHAKGCWIEIENLKDWDRMTLNRFINDKDGKINGRIFYTGEPLNNAIDQAWILQHAGAIRIEIRKANWDHENFLSEYLKKGGFLYYSAVPEEKNYAWFTNRDHAPHIMVNRELALHWKMPYRLGLNFEKNGGKIEGRDEF